MKQPIKPRHYFDAIFGIILSITITLFGIISWLIVPIGIVILVIKIIGG